VPPGHPLKPRLLKPYGTRKISPHTETVLERCLSVVNCFSRPC